jgi:hypothetical protein
MSASGATGQGLKPVAGVVACVHQAHISAGLSLNLPAGTSKKSAKAMEPHYRPKVGAHLLIAKRSYPLQRFGSAYISITPAPRGGSQRETAGTIFWNFKDVTVSEAYLRKVIHKKATIRYSSAATGTRTPKTRVISNDQCGAG